MVSRCLLRQILSFDPPRWWSVLHSKPEACQKKKKKKPSSTDRWSISPPSFSRSDASRHVGWIATTNATWRQIKSCGRKVNNNKSWIIGKVFKHRKVFWQHFKNWMYLLIQIIWLCLINFNKPVRRFLPDAEVKSWLELKGKIQGESFENAKHKETRNKLYVPWFLTWRHL